MIGNYKVSIPSKYVLSMPDMQGNETNPDFNLMLDKYSTNILKRGWKTEIIGANAISYVQELSVQEFLMIMGFGGDVEYFVPFVKVAEADIDNTVPDGLPNRLDDNGNARTWRTWRDAAHPLGDLIADENGNNYYYFMSATFGQALKAAELLAIHNATDAELVDTIPETIQP